MVVANYLKRASSCEDSATQEREELHNSKKTRESELLDPTTTTTTRLSANSSNSNNTRKPTVTFSSTNDVFEISRPTREEKKYMHMSQGDQHQILLEISEALRREQQQQEAFYSYTGDHHHCDNNNNNTIEELCLERIVEQQSSDRLERVKSGVCVILQRQRTQSQRFESSSSTNTKRQQAQLLLDESWLQKHYRPFSEVSSKLARSRGLRDQEMAPSLFPRLIVMSR